MKERGPSRKAKYYLVTDRDKYREGKVKEPREGSEIEHETLCLQADKALYMCDVVLFVERSSELLCMARLSIT